MVFDSSGRAIASVWKNIVSARICKYRLKDPSASGPKRPQLSDEKAL